VATTPAPVADVTPVIHEALRDAELLSDKHLVDNAYVDAELLVDSRREYRVDLIGPTRPNYRWQAKDGRRFAASDLPSTGKISKLPVPQGQRTLKFCSRKDFQQEVFVPAAATAFHGEAVATGMLFQQ
jgi:transposase